jgi:hypothetical protein
MKTAIGVLDVFTFKAGLLAVAAHDLHLRLEQFQVSLDGDLVRAEFPLAQLRLVGPVEQGKTLVGRYQAEQVAQVETAMRGILKADDHPIARFDGRAVSRDDGWEVAGKLSLAGALGGVELTFRPSDGTQRASAELQPSRWGIAEYRALMGAIRLQDRVRLEVTVRERGGT